MKINKDVLMPCLLYNDGFQYNENIILHPVKMKDVLIFQTLSQSITVRKDSIFHDKKIIKMSYLEFLMYCANNKELEDEYEIKNLSLYYLYAIQLLQLCCKNAKVGINQQSGFIYINDILVTPEIFDDLRRIIIIQNDIDFDIDEFLNHDTELSLQKAQEHLNKDNEKVSIEDYIDSLVIALRTTEEFVKNMTIRKFWRYIKRYQLHENYTILKTGECSGMVSFKEPIKHWMCSIEIDDKYQNVKADENSLRDKINGANS